MNLPSSTKPDKPDDYVEKEEFKMKFVSPPWFGKEVVKRIFIEVDLDENSECARRKVFNDFVLVSSRFKKR